MLLPVERSCQALPTIPNNMPTIGPKFRISPLGCENDKCADSNHPDKLNAFYHSTVSSGICLHCATFAEIDSSPTLEVSVLRGLANGNGGLTISDSGQ
jgi:hypothetical protein